jgi:metal-sulfur cluster biosynthetic enzyme
MGTVTTKEQISRALESVIDPELHRSIVELDMVRSIAIGANGVIDVTVSLTTAGCPIRGHFQNGVAQAIAPLEGVTHVNVYFDVLSEAQKAALQQKLGRASLPAGALAQVTNALLGTSPHDLSRLISGTMAAGSTSARPAASAGPDAAAGLASGMSSAGSAARSSRGLRSISSSMSRMRSMSRKSFEWNPRGYEDPRRTNPSRPSPAYM